MDSQNSIYSLTELDLKRISDSIKTFLNPQECIEISIIEKNNRETYRFNDSQSSELRTQKKESTLSKVLSVEVVAKVIQSESAINLQIDHLLLLLENICLRKLTKYQEDTIEFVENFILESEKSKSVGDMISGVTHEINNPLAVILGRIQNIERKIKNQPAFDILQSDLKSLMTSTMRIDRIIKSLRLFAKANQEQGGSHTPIKDLIEQTQVLLNNKLSKQSAELKVHLDEHGPATVYCNPGQIQTILFHLISNSMNALPKEDGQINLKLIDDHDFVIFEIQDNGHGMDEDTLKNYGSAFTDNQNGKKVHMGGSISLKNAENNQSSLKIISSTAQGTIVHLSVPKHPKK